GRISPPRLGSPDTAVTFVLIVGLLGLPVVVVLAWVYQITPDGVRRTSIDDAVPPSGSGSYLVAASVLAVVLAAGWWIVWGRASADTANAVSASSNPRSVAVLPFRDQSPARDQAYLGEGLAEEILTALARVPDLRVVAAQSSFAMATATIDEIEQQLSVTHVLSGSVRTDDGSARISARLTEVITEEVAWQREFSLELSNVLEAQEQIARAVVDVMEIELGAVGADGLMGASTTNEVAHQEYLRGLRLWNRRSESDVLSAIEHFRNAVSLDPDYAAAWAGLAYAYLVLPEYSPDADVIRMREQSAAAAQRALEIDPDQTDALTAMGWGRMIHDYDWETAEDLIARSLSLDSTNVNALHWQSHVVSWQGRHDEAIALARKGVNQDPLSSIMRQNLVFILMEARLYEEALREAERIIADEPALEFRRTVWNINARLGRHAAAADALEVWITSRGVDLTTANELAREYRVAAADFASSGQASRLTRQLVERARLGLEIEGQLHASVGDAEATLNVLERGYRERAGARSLLSVRINPLYEFLLGNPRFEELVRQVGLSTP
ncbi:MAG: hypothetical protein OEU54_02435, partial [Gemmatimonadota bacterium]|nr:hypothetical protein [Gemmatimonadota bacterium]